FIACIFVIRAIFSYAEKLPQYDKPEKPKKEFPNTHKVGFIDSYHSVRKKSIPGPNCLSSHSFHDRLDLNRFSI
ncbi:unnamed protein product, partial [marine sediment metagenome]